MQLLGECQPLPEHYFLAIEHEFELLFDAISLVFFFLIDTILWWSGCEGVGETPPREVPGTQNSSSSSPQMYQL